MIHRRNTTIAAFALLALSSTSALAVDGQAFADRLQAVTTEQGMPLNFSGVSTEGETVVMSAVTLGTGEEALAVGDVRFEDVTGSTADGWQVARIPLADVDSTSGETRTQASGLIIEGFSIGAPAEGAQTLTALQFERAGFESVVVSEGGTEAARFTSLDVTNTPTDTGGFNANFGLESFSVNTQTGEQPEGAATMRELGYETLTGSVTGAAAWETGSGELSLSPLSITVEDAGQLDFSYAISGYTPAFVQSLAAMQQQMEQNPEAAQSSGMAMIGLISQLYLNSADLSFTDNSLTGRLLDYYAQQNGVSRDDLVGQLMQMLPPMLAYVNNPEFQTQVTTAVEAFLRDPQELSITIDPAAPIPATQIIGAAMGAPQTLPAVLNLTVTSNQ